MRSGGRRVRAGAVVRFVSGLVALAALQFLASLLLIGAVGAAFYRTVPVATISGSMTPALTVGDLVVVEPPGTGRLAPGAVVLFRDDARGLVTHRVVEVREDGTYTTKGDANTDADAVPLHRDRIVGKAAMVVPWVGSPAAWYANRHWPVLAGGLAASIAAVYLAIGCLDPTRDPWGGSGRTARRSTARRWRKQTPAAPWAPLHLCLLAVAAAVGLVTASATTPAASVAGFAATSTNGTNTVNGSASFPCTRFPTLTYITGMETGEVTGQGIGLHDSFGVLGGEPDNTSVRARTGTYSMVVPKVANGTSFVGLAQAGSPVLIDRYVLRFDTLPTQNVVQLASVVPASGARVNLGFDAASKRFTFGFAGAASAVSTVTAVAGTWHVIEYRIDVSGTQRTADWRIDEIPQTGSTSNEGASSIATANLGSETSADRYTAYYDDIARSHTPSDYPLGDGRVVALHPNGVDASTANGRFAVAGTSSSTVDASSSGALRMATPSTYVEQTTIDSAANVGVTFDDASEACVRGVMAVAEFQSSTTSANAARTSIIVGGAQQVLRNGSHNSEYLFVYPYGYHPTYQMRVVAPPGGQWTASALNDLTVRFGYGTDVDPRPRWSGLVLMYDTRLPPS